MIILNNMYTGRYITQQGKLGHEAINLVPAQDGKFYIWLNSMGVCPNKKGIDGCSVLMVRTINSHMYKVLAKAENCSLCAGAEISRKRRNSGVEDKRQRAEKQRRLRVTYEGKDPMRDIFHEEDMFATFCSENVVEAIGDVYITNDRTLEDRENHIYYADFTISEAMRAYVHDEHKAYRNLQNVLDAQIWTAIAQPDTVDIRRPEFNFFKLLRKDKDELSFSNAMAYYIEKIGIANFLENALTLPDAFAADQYVLEREKNNIDISFFGNDHVVIIENKIDAYITADSRKSVESQIKNALEAYLKDADAATKTAAENYMEALAAANRNTSQLSKYYFYAVAYLFRMGVDAEQIKERIGCFLLIPEYAKKQFKQDRQGCFMSNFLLSEAYQIITYKDMYEFFEAQETDDRYFEDFLSALRPLRNEFNNDLEQEMKYRFYKAIGAIDD